MFKTIFKDSGIIWIYLLVSMIFGFAIDRIDAEATSPLRLLLGILNIAVFIAILVVYYFAYGRQASKIKHTNDIARRYFLETGDYRELKVDKEYNLLKPLSMALITCIPLVLFIILYLIFDLTGSVDYSGGVNFVFSAIIIVLTLYRGFVVPFRALSINASIYWSLIYIPIVVGTVMIAYFLGHKRSQRDLKQIKKTHKEIYGENK